MAIPVTLKSRLRILLSPWTVLVSIGVGIALGFYARDFSGKLTPIGDIYISLLQMCLVPILMCSITGNIARLLKTGEERFGVTKIALMFAFGMFIASSIGVLAGALGQVGGGLSKEAQATLGHLLIQSDKSAAQNLAHAPIGFVDFFKEMVPANIFSAVTQGKNLSVIVFSILLGVSLGLLNSAGSATTLVLTETLFEALLNIMSGIIYGLPLGLICILASQVSHVGLDIFTALGKFIAFTYLGSIALVILYSALLMRASRISFWRSIMALKEPYVVALGTSSSLASIPSAIQALEKNLGVSKEAANLLYRWGFA